MIINLERFIDEERPYWTEFETLLDRIAADPDTRRNLEEIKRFHYLYQRTSSDLSKIQGFAREPELGRYLEDLVARAFGEVHEVRQKPHRFTPFRWFFHTFPQTFRRHIRAFRAALLITLVGALLGAAFLAIDPASKDILMPFSHLTGDPSDRVAAEESRLPTALDDGKSSFSSYLMTHNTRVAIFCMALGITFGIGTLILLFHNGVILGAVFFDYINAGETEFLFGWLLPHGVIEIPAILIAGQAGLVLAGALIDNRSGIPLGQRMRRCANDLLTLIGGVGVLLIWAGIIEAFVSQYHQPMLPYALKTGFGVLELAALILFLTRAGTKTPDSRIET
ncbi:MAG: stage II sporulation protein M [Desulfuromonadales bacterium]|nr:stage II sporulation protein M [Desulfuromonadales bacterium]